MQAKAARNTPLTILKYHGGKGAHNCKMGIWIWEHISRLITDDHVFVDACVGGGTMTLLANTKKKVLNDIDKSLALFWLMVKMHPAELQHRVRTEYTDYSQETYLRAESRLAVGMRAYPDLEVECFQAELQLPEGLKDIAVAYFVVNRLSRQGLMASGFCRESIRTRRGMPEMESAYRSATSKITLASARLVNTSVMSTDALHILGVNACPSKARLFMMLDPPYHADTRVSTNAYAHEVTNDWYAALVSQLNASPHAYALCNYEHPIFEHLQGATMHRKSFVSNSSGGSNKPQRVEALYVRPALY